MQVEFSSEPSWASTPWGVFEARNKFLVSDPTTEQFWDSTNQADILLAFIIILTVIYTDEPCDCGFEVKKL